jgi:hypothetical protein
MQSQLGSAGAVALLALPIIFAVSALCALLGSHTWKRLSLNSIAVREEKRRAEQRSILDDQRLHTLVNVRVNELLEMALKTNREQLPPGGAKVLPAPGTGDWVRVMANSLGAKSRKGTEPLKPNEFAKVVKVEGGRVYIDTDAPENSLLTSELVLAIPANSKV